MTGHCDADVLAEFREGLLGRWRSARVRAHLAGCPRCASLSSQLADVTALLASAPAPVMPDKLVARLDRVLAAESAARKAEIPAAAAGAGDGTAPDGTAAGGGAPGGGGTAGESTGGAGAGRHRGRRPMSGGRRHDGRPVPGRAARPPGSRRVTALRAASVTAAVLVIAGGGYGVSRLLQGGGATSTAGGQSGQGAAGSSAHAAKRNGGISLPAGLAPGGLAVIQSGTDYVRGQLASQAETVLARQAARAAVGALPANSGSTPITLPGCVRLVTGGTRASLVDLASYQGRPATVIMLETEGNPPGQVWVVAPDCSARGRDLIAHAPLPGAD